MVGRRLPDNENLGLAYLKAALTHSGVVSRVHVLNDWSGLDNIADRAVADHALLVGLSIPDGGSAILPLTLGELLRRRGYRGHITCGGSFATLARQWLLERYEWLDSVVRFAGEVPLLGLVRALEEGRAWDEVAGVTTRAGDGLPAPVLDPLAMQLVPEHGELPEVVGYPMAHILATRGCRGRCTYCGPASWQAQEVAEGRRAGVHVTRLRLAGVGSVRRRPVDDICDEMATLHRERGVRYWYFVDEHLLPYQEQEALDWIEQFGRGLRRRQLGAKVAIGTMLRADRITPAVVEAFANVGLVRAFVGIEFGTIEESRRYGRATDPAQAARLLTAFERAGVAVVSNMMLVHPHSTSESISAGVDFLAKLPSGVFETTRMQAYHGTRLWEALRRDGRLTGNPLRYSYGFADPTVARFADIFMRLRAEAFWNHSIAYRTHDAFLAAVLQKRFRARGFCQEVWGELDAVRQRVNDLYVTTYREALVLAQQGCGASEAQPLIRQARESSVQLGAQLDSCVDRLVGRPESGRTIFSPMRAAAQSAVAFGVLSVSIPACSGDVFTVAVPVADASDRGGSGGSAGSGNAGSARGGASGQGGGIRDGQADSIGADSGGMDVVTGDVATEPLARCTPNEVQWEHDTAIRAVQANAPCFSGSITFAPGSPPNPVFGAQATGNPMIQMCPNQPGNDQAAHWLEDAARSALKGVDAHCLAEQSAFLDIPGGAGADAGRMADVLNKMCSQYLPSLGQVMIVVDAQGNVVKVTGRAVDPPPQVLNCITQALAGLTFPCLAGFVVCPEPVIAE